MGCTGSKTAQASKPQETQGGATLLTDSTNKPVEQKPATEPSAVVMPAESGAVTEQRAPAEIETPEAGEKAPEPAATPAAASVAAENTVEAPEAPAAAPAAVEDTAEAPAATPVAVEEVVEPVSAEAHKTEEAAPASDNPEVAEQLALQAVADDMVEEAADADMAKEPVQESVLNAAGVAKQEAPAMAKSGLARFGTCCSYCAADDKAAELVVVQKQN